MKFMILPKVSEFSDASGVRHLPGDVVELPESYLGETWLEPVLENPTDAETPKPEPMEPEKPKRRKAESPTT